MARSKSPKSSRDSTAAERARRGAATKGRTDGEHGSAQASSSHRPQQRRRRSEDPGRQRDPARTRQLILDAAVEEFGQFGYDGARVMRISERAGVAHQLITYHFGGKKGLFEALSDQWADTAGSLAGGDASFMELLPELVRKVSDNSVWERVLIREEQQGRDRGHLAERLAPILAIARERQLRGEIAAELDPGIVTLLFFAANLAPAGLPHLTRAFSKVDPDDPEFVDYYTEQLGRVLKRLSGPPTASS